jgi:RNA polymerase sigma-70 factor (ECF subfamily)
MGQDLDLLPGTSEDGRDAYPERALARSVLERFDVGTQAIAVAVFVEGMELEEIAAELGLSPRTVSKRLRRFIRDAREFLAEVGEERPATAG